jgi:hypothetical protein
MTRGFSKNEMPMPMGILFFKMLHKFLYSMAIPPNTLDNISKVLMLTKKNATPQFDYYGQFCH